MLKEAAEIATRSKSGEISIDLEASHNNKLPRLDLIRNEKLVQKNSSSFFDQDDDVFGSGDGKDTKYKVKPYAAFKSQIFWRCREVRNSKNLLSIKTLYSLDS